MTREEILAIRATGLALVAQCDAALARVESPASAGVGEPNVFDALRARIDCSHPPDRVISTAVPGNPLRGKCSLCGVTVTRAA